MRRLVVLLLSLALVAGSCADDGTDDGAEATSTTVADTTTTSTVPELAGPEFTAADLAATGPSPVGVTTRELPTGNLVEIWYPAGPDAEGATDTYSLRDFTPAVIRDLVPAELDDRVTVDAGRDASVAVDGPYPLVLFSHGAAAFRSQSSNLAHHLASWGIVVASADHPSRSFESFVAPSDDPQPAPDDMLATLELLKTDEMLASAIDFDRVGLSGHSAGGGTLLTVAEGGGFAGYVSLASGAFEDGPLPDLPSMFMAGGLDSIAEPARTLDAFERAPAPSWYVEFEATGHNAFTDLCAVGDDDAGVLSLLLAAGLEALLTDQVRSLAADGCLEPNRPVGEVWPGINQAATGFFRYVFGMDPEPLGLDAPAVRETITDSK